MEIPLITMPYGQARAAFLEYSNSVKQRHNEEHVAIKVKEAT